MNPVDQYIQSLFPIGIGHKEKVEIFQNNIQEVIERMRVHRCVPEFYNGIYAAISSSVEFAMALVCMRLGLTTTRYNSPVSRMMVDAFFDGKKKALYKKPYTRNIYPAQKLFYNKYEYKIRLYIPPAFKFAFDQGDDVIMVLGDYQQFYSLRTYFVYANEQHMPDLLDMFIGCGMDVSKRVLQTTKPTLYYGKYLYSITGCSPDLVNTNCKVVKSSNGYSLYTSDESVALHYKMLGLKVKTRA